MLSQLILPLAFVTELLLGGPASGASAANVVVAQSGATQLVAASDRAERAVVAARGKVRRLSAEMRALDATYKRQLSELDRLTRQRASWNRDRKISKQKAASQVTARQLSAAARELRVAKRRLAAAKRRLLAALERELSAGSAEAATDAAAPPGEGRRRAARLATLRDKLRRELRPKPRKIVVPDIDIDATDDPDDLEEKARILVRVEAQLRAEQTQLDRRFAYYSRQERLRAQRERANEIDRTEGTSIRRTTGIGNTGTNSGLGASDAEADPGAPNEDSGSGGDDFSDRGDLALETSSVVLADVVDEVTAGDLRRASRSTNPATRARAAGKALDQVKARLERLRRTRRAIERRARALRK